MQVNRFNLSHRMSRLLQWYESTHGLPPHPMSRFSKPTGEALKDLEDGNSSMQGEVFFFSMLEISIIIPSACE